MISSQENKKEGHGLVTLEKKNILLRKDGNTQYQCQTGKKNNLCIFVFFFQISEDKKKCNLGR